MPYASDENEVDDLDGVDDYTQEEVQSSSKAPRVFSIDPYRCFAVGDTESCNVGQEHNITVNQRNAVLGYDYDGDGRDDADRDRDGEVDDFVADETFSAVVNFFAYADENQMPIRRVLVDWRDDSRILDQKGFYKNRKPLCAPSEVTPIGECNVSAYASGDDLNHTKALGHPCFSDLDCQGTVIPTCEEFAEDLENELERPFQCTGNRNEVNRLLDYGARCVRPSVPSFGDVPRACEQNYFTFTHSYTCHKS